LPQLTQAVTTQEEHVGCHVEESTLNQEDYLAPAIAVASHIRGTMLESQDEAPKRNIMSLCESPNFLSGGFIDNKSLPKIEPALTPRRLLHVF
jgi:hypothetical protein